MTVSWASISDRGNREVNEDYVLIHEQNCLLSAALADGLGGHGMGDTASRIAAAEAIRVLSSGGTLEDSFMAAETAVMKEQGRLNVPNKMKTTLCLLQISGKKVQAGHIGDSRIYYFKNGRFVKRTLDHSIPQLLVNSGEISEKEIRFHEDRNMLTRVIGTEWNEPGYELEKPFLIHPTDLLGRKIRHALLLCTDGWWEYVGEEEMLKSLNNSATPEDWLGQMKKIVQENGRGRDMDNYSAVAVFCGI
ncbi:MAG: protein phosphatase 2C domain-containing protein [Lachnospiraceae bacterium]|nr:protein phosphatase 2C domain-containing protein [Lachnospiraceae bacterium]